jgi:hypothetical protein
MRHAVINGSSKVVNVIQLVDLAGWPPPSGCYVVQTDTGDIGDFYDGTNFITPVVTPHIPPPMAADQLFDILMLNRSLSIALIRALNDGSFPIGGNLPAAQIKTILKAKL